MQIIKAEIHHLDLVRDLFREYQAWLDNSCCFQGFEEELASLPGSYARPTGDIYLAFDGKYAIACAAIRPASDNPETEAELKRLYVKDTYRGHGIGKDIFHASMSDAKEMGYKAVVLETLPEQMQSAQFLYRDYGFELIPNYRQDIDKESDSGVECYRHCFDKNIEG